MKLFGCLLAGLLLVLTGCASDPFTRATKAGIHIVQLAPVEYGDMRFGPPPSTSRLDDPWGMNRTDMMNDVGQDGLHRMQKLMQKQNLDVPQMVYDHVKAQLEKQSEFTITTKPPADGTLTVKVVQFGFVDVPFSLMHELPFITLQAELRDKTGHKIWTRKTSFSLPASDEAGASWDEYESHPDELRDEWIGQVSHAVQRLFPDQND